MDKWSHLALHIICGLLSLPAFFFDEDIHLWKYVLLRHAVSIEVGYQLGDIFEGIYTLLNDE